jgi:predicted nucleic acid-binding protein
MKEGKVFVDTNILVYAYDSSAGDKHKMAVELMSRLWASGDGIISSQVLQEYFVCVTRKIVKPLDVRTAKEIVKDLLKWKTVIVTGEILLEAIDILSVHKSSFWDSMIIASAIEGGARTILSEDLSNNQLIKGITIRNPFSILK